MAMMTRQTTIPIRALMPSESGSLRSLFSAGAGSGGSEGLSIVGGGPPEAPVVDWSSSPIARTDISEVTPTVLLFAVLMEVTALVISFVVALLVVILEVSEGRPLVIVFDVLPLFVIEILFSVGETVETTPTSADGEKVADVPLSVCVVSASIEVVALDWTSSDVAEWFPVVELPLEEVLDHNIVALAGIPLTALSAVGLLLAVVYAILLVIGSLPVILFVVLLVVLFVVLFVVLLEVLLVVLSVALLVACTSEVDISKRISTSITAGSLII